MAANYGLNFYKRMGNAYRQALKNAPTGIESEMEVLGELLDDFAPYVGSGGYEPGDLEEIKDAQQNNAAISALGRAVDGVKVKKLFVTNGLEMVYKLALSSFNKTNDEGDILLGKIADQCGLIASKVVQL